MINNDQRKKIMLRRWLITAIITIITITGLGLWTIAFTLNQIFNHHDKN